MTDSPYSYEFDPEGDSTAARVLRFTGSDKYVLELGCAYGVMTKVLVEENNCKVFGIEYDEHSAQQAKEYCNELAIIDIEKTDLNQVLGNKRFDVIVAADVLEHLHDPLSVLCALKEFLATDGYIVLSLPNVAYNGIIAELLNEDFRYRETGLLDKTHLKFWGLRGIERLLHGSGFVVDCIEKTEIDIDLSEFSEAWSSLPDWLAVYLSHRSEGKAYQYIIKALPIENISSNKKIDWLAQTKLPSFKEIDEQIDELKSSLREAEVKSENCEQQFAQLSSVIDQMKNTMSWRITRPFRFIWRVVRSGLLQQDRRLISKGIRNRYHKLPLPTAIKRIISIIYHRLFGEIFRVFRQIVANLMRFKAPTISPATQQEGLHDYIVWGVIDWHFRHQRPQQLAQALAATGRRVFYVSPLFVDDGRDGFEIEKLDNSDLIFQVNLFVKRKPSIYKAAPGIEIIDQLKAGIGEVLLWASCGRLISLVQHPFWHEVASILPNSHLVYDCMDHHDGFGNTGASLMQLENQLLRSAELTVVTSAWLEESISNHAQNYTLIRNAGNYDHFCKQPLSVYKDPKGRNIIGYYGAIAEWFDIDLVEKVAKRFTECAILLIGEDSVNASSRLGKLPNVMFIGEVPYDQLPYYLYSFDVCMLPFMIVPLTMATNPVKAYEYLSAGKPLVAVDLPEMHQFGELVYIASGSKEYLDAVNNALNVSESEELMQKRKDFATGQTWKHRAEDLIRAVESIIVPKVSIIVVTYNNLELTKSCLSSIDEHSLYENIEIIVVDNASSDGSKEFLKNWEAETDNRKLMLNDENLGFAAANNQGLEVATGDYLVMLNNDTYVTPGWIGTLVGHLKRDKTIGLIGPVTNNIGNEAKIDIHYDDMGGMLDKASAFTRRHIGNLYPLNTAAFFCVMLRRETFEEVGVLDEAFGIGFFEDDDFCRRIEKIGLRIVCAEDVFVHHNLSASFDKIADDKRMELFNRNKEIYEKKWGKWMPHEYR